MTTRSTCLGFLTLLVVQPTPTVGQSVDRLTDALERARAEVGAPGAVLGVVVGDAPPVVVSTGLADRESGRLMDPDDPFHLGSVSKTWTAVLTLRLAEEGLLELEDPVSRWVPELPRSEEITLGQLLTHTSGLKDFYSWFYYRPDRDEMIDLVTREWTQDELIELSGRFGHWFEPGEDWSYSNAGYFLLGVAAERVTGEALADLYRSRIGGPLDLDGFWIEGHEDPRGELAIGYMGPVEGWVHSEMFGELGPTTVLDRGTAEWAAGGLAAPASDALRFLHGLFDGDVLDDGFLARMTDFRDTPSLGVPGPEGGGERPPDGYGMGLVRMSVGDVELVGHGGLYNGHTTGLWHVAACDLTIVTYMNRGFVGQRPVLGVLLPEVMRGVDCPGW